MACTETRVERASGRRTGSRNTAQCQASRSRLTCNTPEQIKSLYKMRIHGSKPNPMSPERHVPQQGTRKAICFHRTNRFLSHTGPLFHVNAHAKPYPE